MTRDFRRLIAWLVIAALGTYLLFFGGAWYGLYLTDLRIVSVAAAGALLAAWAFVAHANAAWRPRSVLMPAILLCLSSLAISTMFSRFPRISLEYLGYAALLASLYLLLVRLLADPFFRRRIVALASVLFVVVVVGYVVAVGRHWVDWWTVSGVLAVPPLRPNYEALVYGTPSTEYTVAAMLAVPALATVLRWERMRGVAVGAVVVLVASIALLTGSRAGWVATAVAGVAAVTLVVVDRETRSELVTAASLRFTPIAVIVIVLAAAIAIVLAPAILHRASDGGEATRLTFTRIALELFAESPAVGTGPGSWVIQRVRYTHPDEIDEYIPHAHNVYAQTLGELGLVGALVGLLLVASLASLCWRAIRSADRTRRTWGWLTFVALVYFGAHQIFDFYPNMPAVLFTAAVPVAFLDALSAEDRPSGLRGLRFSTLPRAAEAAALAVIAVSVAGLLVQEGPSRLHDQAVQLANNGDWTGALAPASAAASQDPMVSPYQFTAGLAEARSGNHAAAAERFARVAQRDDFPEAWLNLAAEQTELGQPDDAVRSLRAALRLGDQRPVIAMAAGDLALRLGDGTLATEAFGAALAVTPSLAGDPWWSRDPSRIAIWPAILKAADERIQEMRRWELALMYGDVGLATSLAGESSDAPYSLEVIRGWQGDASALEALFAGCDADPRAIAALLWCSRLADRAGNLEAGRRYRFVANVTAEGAYRQAHELRVNQAPPTAFPLLEGGAATSWGTYTYRRAMAWDLLAPGLVRLSFG